MQFGSLEQNSTWAAMYTKKEKKERVVNLLFPRDLLVKEKSTDRVYIFTPSFFSASFLSFARSCFKSHNPMPELKSSSFHSTLNRLSNCTRKHLSPSHLFPLSLSLSLSLSFFFSRGNLKPCVFFSSSFDEALITASVALTKVDLFYQKVFLAFSSTFLFTLSLSLSLSLSSSLSHALSPKAFTLKGFN